MLKKLSRTLSKELGRAVRTRLQEITNTSPNNTARETVKRQRVAQPFQRKIIIITTTFALEPVIRQYLKQYPAGEFTSYQIVFESMGEYRTGEYSYIIVLERNKKPQPNDPQLRDFLEAYCKLHKQAAIMTSPSYFPYANKKSRPGTNTLGNWSEILQDEQG